MKFSNIYKTLFVIFVVLFTAGCAVNQNGQTPQTGVIYGDEDKVDTVFNNKKIDYTREAISEKLLQRIYSMIQAMSSNDISQINEKYIHKKFGFYNLLKVEGVEVFNRQELIYNVVDEDTEEISHLISRVTKKDALLTAINEDAKFDCSPNDDAFYGWNKDGLYISDKINIDLTSLMKKFNEFEPNKYKEEDLLKAKLIEKTSYRVVLTPEIVFYIAKIDGEWFITLIDRTATDCSSI